jgi:hypothetical protein
VRYTTRPLSGWDGPRTPHPDRRSRYAFRASWADTLELLERELRYLDARDLVLEADFREQDLRLDGMPRSSAREPIDPGVRLSFESKHGPLVYQCDSVDYWKANVRSIALGLDALRAVDRYGITRRAQQYAGWRQIGSGPAIVTEPPMDRAAAARLLVLWAYPHPSNAVENPGRAHALEQGLLDLDVIARRAQRHTHPDTGGDAEHFGAVQRAIAVLRGAR